MAAGIVNQMRYTKRGYVDVKLDPVANKSVLEGDEYGSYFYKEGMCIYVIDEKRDYVFNGTTWEPKLTGAEIYIEGDDVK